MPADDLLDALDPEQRAVATALTGPVCVLAGAGTGKTRAITHRIAYGVRTGVYRPAGVLAVTFTARAAGEMRLRLRALGAGGVQARTFHSAALRQLGFFWPRVVGGAPPRLLEQKAPVVADAGRRAELSGVDRIAVRDLAAEIEWAKVSLVPADDYVAVARAAGRPAPAGFDPQDIPRLMSAYEDAKEARGVIDFEDVLLLTAAMLAQRGEVADEVRSQYRHFVVDEYQDVSPLQQYLLDQWLGGRHDVCVVGDPSQTIYSFAGASPRHLLEFAKAHPRTTRIDLVRDYRSTPQVVRLANAVLVTAPKRAGYAPLQLVAQRPDGPPVQWTTYPDDEAEAAGVAARIARLVTEGTPASRMAVLYRTNVQAEAFEDALSRAGVGYQLRGSDRFFSRQDVRQAVLLLRGAARSAGADEPMPQLARDVLLSAGWAPAPPAERGQVRERWDAMQALVGLADEVAAAADGRPATLADLVAELDERAAAQQAPTAEGVTLASLHAAKGLEWDVVFLVGLSEGLLPISLAETEAARDEERRLLYVGVTRARDRLELSWAKARTPGSRATRTRTSFLDDLWPTERAGGVQGDGDPAATRARVRLLRWRAEQAAAEGKGERAVLSDAVLAELARLRPGSTETLARVRGFGQSLMVRYGTQVLAVLSGDGDLTRDGDASEPPAEGRRARRGASSERAGDGSRGAGKRVVTPGEAHLR